MVFLAIAAVALSPVSALAEPVTQWRTDLSPAEAKDCLLKQYATHGRFVTPLLQGDTWRIYVQNMSLSFTPDPSGGTLLTHDGMFSSRMLGHIDAGKCGVTKRRDALDAKSG